MYIEGVRCEPIDSLNCVCVCMYLQHELDDALEVWSQELGTLVSQVNECLQQRIVLLFLHTSTQNLVVRGLKLGSGKRGKIRSSGKRVICTWT